jgi:hypothetical protein
MFEQIFFVLALTCHSAPGPMPLAAHIAMALVTQQQPDTTKAKRLERWPTHQDLAKLESAEGKPRWLVLVILGHPSSVERRADGVEVWGYPWLAWCEVRFRNGMCTETFYTAGY